MTEAVQVALIIAVPTFITALGGLIVSLRTAFKTEQIHTATNGTLHEMKANDKVQIEKMAGLEKQIAMLLEDKRQSVETAKSLAGEAKTLALDVKTATLLATKTTPAIEENTKAVLDNTEATDQNTDQRSGVKPKRFG